MADNYIDLPSSTIVSTGVTSLNTITGALTLIAGSGITVTPSGSTLTIAAGSGTSGAFSTADSQSVTVTNGIVTGIAAGGASTLIVNRKTADYTLIASDSGKLIEMNVAGANILNVPTNASVSFPIGTQILISQYGAGQTSVLAAGGVTINSAGGKLKLNVQFSGATLVKSGTNEWYLFGDITV